MKRNAIIWLVLALMVLGTVPAAFSADEAKSEAAAPAAATAVPAIKMVAGAITEISGNSLKLDQRGTSVSLTIGAEASIRKGAETIDASKLVVGDQVLALVSGENEVKSLFVKTVPAAAPAEAPAPEAKSGY